MLNIINLNNLIFVKISSENEIPNNNKKNHKPMNRRKYKCAKNNSSDGSSEVRVKIIFSFHKMS